ncbi:MAG: hypothetical protein ACOC0P_05980 [Planctomycetota bacterium]
MFVLDNDDDDDDAGPQAHWLWPTESICKTSFPVRPTKREFDGRTGPSDAKVE